MNTEPAIRLFDVIGRPISTAPKDGTAILVWQEFQGFWVAAWRPPVFGEPQFASHRVNEWRDANGRFATPSLWWELPNLKESAIGTPLSELSGRPGQNGFDRFCDISESWGY